MKKQPSSLKRYRITLTSSQPMLQNNGSMAVVSGCRDFVRYIDAANPNLARNFPELKAMG